MHLKSKRNATDESETKSSSSLSSNVQSNSNHEADSRTNINNSEPDSDVSGRDSSLSTTADVQILEKKASVQVQAPIKPKQSEEESPLHDYMFFLNRKLAAGEITLAMLEAALGAERDHFDSWDLDKSGVLDMREWAAMSTDIDRRRGQSEPSVVAAASSAEDDAEDDDDVPAGGVAARAAARRRFAVADRDGSRGVSFDEHVGQLLRREARSVATAFWGYIDDPRRAAA